MTSKEVAKWLQSWARETGTCVEEGQLNHIKTKNETINWKRKSFVINGSKNVKVRKWSSEVE